MSVCDYLICHMIAFGLGFLLDLMLGDPEWLYHPVRMIGNWITFLERVLRKGEGKKKQLRKGFWLVVLVLWGTVAVTTMLIVGSYTIYVYLGIAVETILTWQILAVKSLRVESMRVYACLQGKKERETKPAADLKMQERQVGGEAEQALAAARSPRSSAWAKVCTTCSASPASARIREAPSEAGRQRIRATPEKKDNASREIAQRCA